MPCVYSRIALPLNKQTALITGAGSAEGIGFAVARKLHAAGVRVAITSTTDRIHTRARELDAGGDWVLSFIADLTEETDVQRLVDVYRRSGRFDVTIDPKIIELQLADVLGSGAKEQPGLERDKSDRAEGAHGRARQHGAEVEAWIYDTAGQSSQPEPVISSPIRNTPLMPSKLE